MNNRTLALEAHHAMWATSFWLAEFPAALEHIEKGLRLYDRERDRSLAFLYGGHDPGTCCRTFFAWTHWLLGRPAQAVEASNAAVTLAEQIAHPPSMAITLTWACALRYFERDARETRSVARRLIDLAEERDLPAWRVAGTIFEGWARVQADESPLGLAQIREGLVAAKSTGTLMPIEPLYRLVLTDACVKLGQIEDGLRVIDETVAAMEVMGLRVWLSELHRLKAQLVLMRTPSDDAEADASLRQALSIARQQQALAWELPAATSLAQLLAQHGRRDEARQTLGEVYARFTEGFETANLREAAALLAKLS
jgi:adenylate cyclase